tara:strand:+ start:2675 stop:3745 length:1071 start_codon:yes stop_codon:yes gene_type:complete
MASLDPPFGTIPTSPDEMTITWLSTIFTKHGFSAGIEALDFRPIDNPSLSSELLRIVTRVQDETTGVAPPLIWKRSSRTSSLRKEFGSCYETEVHFYKKFAHEIDVSVPRCFAAAYCEDTDEHVLLLEDMTPKAADNQTEDILIKYTEGVLRELVQLHAACWSVPSAPRSIDTFVNMKSFVTESAIFSSPYLNKHVDRHSASRSKYLENHISDLLSALSSGPQTLTHGDVQIANIIFPRRSTARPYFIDWQNCQINNPLRDIARFLILNFTIENRRKYEEDIIAIYHTALKELGFNYKSDTATRDYRLASILEWYWVMNFSRYELYWDLKTRSRMPILARRTSAAFDDAKRWLELA